jgi:hypothetical protein
MIRGKPIIGDVSRKSSTLASAVLRARAKPIIYANSLIPASVYPRGLCEGDDADAMVEGTLEITKYVLFRLHMMNRAIGEVLRQL